MKTVWVDKSTPATGFATLLFALFLIYAGDCAAQCITPVPPMTIKIYNASTAHNIYPVLSSGTATTDVFLQAACQVPKSQLAANPYPKLRQFRLYINPTGDGIPPGGNVTITLPFYTQLVPTNQVNPKLPSQYIDWWGGGRIEIFKSPNASHQPPVALTMAYLGSSPGGNRPKQVKVTPILGAAVPTCLAPACQPLQIFKDPAGLKNNEPTQLIEYTLGALNFSTAGDLPYGLDLHNVDYDVSYVDTAYLPAVMEPFNNMQVGYIGAPQSINAFRDALKKFIIPSSPFTGWPQFVDNQKTTILKIPSALHLLAGDPDMTPPPWPPINTMQTLWQTCTSGNGTIPICPFMRDVKALFKANYNNYVATYHNPAFGCDPDGKNPNPVPLTVALMFAHVHGWGPFVENCTNAAGNLLENTPGYFTTNPDGTKNYAKYQMVKDEFDELQYWPPQPPPTPPNPNGKFNPYVVLIHGEDYVNAPNTYAYSVDDAVGNMQVAGDGLIIAVGGLAGMPNPNPATPPIHVNFGFSKTDKVKITMYGICTKTPDKNVNPDFPSFAISANNPKSCPLSFVDNNGLQYTFRILTQPPYPPTNHLTPKTHAPIDCTGNTAPLAQVWCNQIFAYTVQGNKRNSYFAITPAPTQPPPGLHSQP